MRMPPASVRMMMSICSSAYTEHLAATVPTAHDWNDVYFNEVSLVKAKPETLQASVFDMPFDMNGLSSVFVMHDANAGYLTQSS